MNPEKKPHLAFKLWLETEEGYVFGPGIYSLLCKVEEKGTLKEAAINLGMSYRYAWGLLKKAEDKLGAPLTLTYKGGREGGGGAVLTDQGQKLIKEFELLRDSLKRSSIDIGKSNFLVATIESILNEDNNKIVTLNVKNQMLKVNVPPNENFKINDKMKIRISFIEPIKL